MRRRRRRRGKSKGMWQGHGQEQQHFQEGSSRVHISLLAQPSPLLQQPPIQRWRSASSLGEATIWGPTTELTDDDKKTTDPSSCMVWGSIISLASLSVRTG